MMGTRLPDTPFGELPVELDKMIPGAYWKYLNRKTGEPLKASDYQQGKNSAPITSNLTNTVWGYWSPDGNGMGTLVLHTVREHEDGTISVLPGDGSSNSIKHEGGATKKVWHGYIRKGDWQAS